MATTSSTYLSYRGDLRQHAEPPARRAVLAATPLLRRLINPNTDPRDLRITQDAAQRFDQAEPPSNEASGGQQFCAHFQVILPILFRQRGFLRPAEDFARYLEEDFFLFAQMIMQRS